MAAMLSQVTRLVAMVRFGVVCVQLTGTLRPVLNSAGLLREVKWAREAKGAAFRSDSPHSQIVHKLAQHGSGQVASQFVEQFLGVLVVGKTEVREIFPDICRGKLSKLVGLIRCEGHRFPWFGLTSQQ